MGGGAPRPDALDPDAPPPPPFTPVPAPPPGPSGGPPPPDALDLVFNGIHTLG